MIGTIGFLVQEPSTRWRWLGATSLYTIACAAAAAGLGAMLAAAGQLVLGAICADVDCRGGALAGLGLVGMLAVAYAASDAGLLRLPRPALMVAVPVTWWRWWRPYRAAIAYGAALGVGVMTRVHFGALYVLCAWSALSGDPAYGALLMGTYGAARALVLFPASWGVLCHRDTIDDWLFSPLFSLPRAQRVVAFVLMVFGVQALISVALVTFQAA